VKYSYADLSGLIVDKHCFPLETLGGEIRALLIPVKVFSGIFADLRERYGKSVWAIAYHQGKSLGELVAKYVLKRFPVPSKELIEVLAQIYSAYGWGRMEIVAPNRVIIRDNFEVEGYGRVDESVCHFTRGVLSGGILAVWGEECEIIETSCKAKGDKYCEFISVRRR